MFHLLHLLPLFALLSHPEFEVREHAAAELLHLVDRDPSAYGPLVASLAGSSTCPEQRARSRPIVACYDRWRVNSFVPTTAPVWPCCDMMPLANPVVPFGLGPELRDRYTGCPWLAGGGSGSADAGPHWHRYRAATERMVRERLRDGWTWEEADRLVGRMWVIEQAARGDCDAAKWAVSGTWRGWMAYPQCGRDP